MFKETYTGSPAIQVFDWAKYVRIKPSGLCFLDVGGKELVLDYLEYKDGYALDSLYGRIPLSREALSRHNSALITIKTEYMVECPLGSVVPMWITYGIDFCHVHCANPEIDGNLENILGFATYIKNSTGKEYLELRVKDRVFRAAKPPANVRIGYFVRKV